METQFEQEEFDPMSNGIIVKEGFADDTKNDGDLEEGTYYISCKATEGATKIDGYLASTRNGWATISPRKHLWRLVQNKEESNKFYLKSLQDPKDGYYLGHRKGTKAAGLYYLYASSDWLQYDKNSEKLLNVDARSGSGERTFFGRHKAGGYYWVTKAEAATSKYLRIHCTFDQIS